MKDKRILYVSSEVAPYLPDTEMALTAFNAARKAHSKGVQTRIFMPRFGVINERRHQLHEVIRLSGMNLIINDMDMPLIIKVASIPKEMKSLEILEIDGSIRSNLNKILIHISGYENLKSLSLKKNHIMEIQGFHLVAPYKRKLNH